MKAEKKARRLARTAFTKLYTAFMATLAKEESTREERTVGFQLLECNMAELETIHTQYNQLLLESGATDAEVTKEMESDDAYKTNFFTARLKMADRSESQQQSTIPPTPGSGTRNEGKANRLPKIELP